MCASRHITGEKTFKRQLQRSRLQLTQCLRCPRQDGGIAQRQAGPPHHVPPGAVNLRSALDTIAFLRGSGNNEAWLNETGLRKAGAASQR